MPSLISPVQVSLRDHTKALLVAHKTSRLFFFALFFFVPISIFNEVYSGVSVLIVGIISATARMEYMFV